jgi:cytochrome c oxidase assembly factor CtaG
MLRPFGFQTVFTVWQFAPIVTSAVVILAGLYLWGVRRVARRHPARPWPAWRTGMFLGGLAVVVLATESGIGAYDDMLFWDHMVQHLMLIMVAPPLLIFGQPITLLMHASRNPLHTWAKRILRSRVVSFLTWPVFGCVAYAVTVIGTHLTGFANLAQTNRLALNGEHALFLVVGYLFFMPILGGEPIRWRLTYPVRFVILVLLMPVDTFTGLILGYGTAGTPGVPSGPRPAWAPPPVSDLHLGGAVMWIGGDAIMFGLMMLVYMMWSLDSRAATSGHGWFEAARRASMGSLVTAHQAAAAGGSGGAEDGAAAGTGTAPPAVSWDGRGGIDDDEHLAAYNAYLARLNDAESGRKQ